MVYDMADFWVFLLSGHGIVPQKTNILTSDPPYFSETPMKWITKIHKSGIKSCWSRIKSQMKRFLVPYKMGDEKVDGPVVGQLEKKKKSYWSRCVYSGPVVP